MNNSEKTYECGCSIKEGRSGNPFIVYCPKHKAAPEMYEALKIGVKLADAIIRDIEKQKGKTPSVEVLMARATMSEAMAKAEGGK